MTKIEKLEKVTKDTLKILEENNIVFPLLYKKTFCENAKNLNCNIEDILKEQYDENIDTILNQTQFLEKTTNILNDNLEKASIAIKNKDDKYLLEIQKELYLLKKELIVLTNELYFDELTQIYNRKWLFKNYLNQEVFKNDGVLVFIDLNNFKKINDTYGHNVGDKVLKLFSKHISMVKDSIAVRLAGNEFLLFFNYQDIENIKKELDNINEDLFKKSFKFKNSDLFKIHFSYGYSIFKNGDIFHDILEKAGRKEMYKHKKMKKVKN